MDDLLKRLQEANTAYRKGEPIISDQEYDYLLEKLPEDHPYRNTVEPEKIFKNRIKHNIPMLSMQKAKTDQDMNKWFNKVEKAILSMNLPSDFAIIRATPKLDGIAGKFKSNKVITRGDGQYGNDITNVLEKGINIAQFNITSNQILGEFVVKMDYYNKHLKNKFSHPRNFVSGAIMADDLNSDTQEAFNQGAVVFQAYSALKSINDRLSIARKDFRSTERLVSEFNEYKIDGVIFEVINSNIKEVMGETESYPNWAIALKPKDSVYESEILEISWNTGRTGKVTPVAIIKPIVIDGVTVEKASAHNAKNVITMGLDIGKRIEIIRSGSVIPYIVGVIE